jgi:hypothetical protein
MLKRLFPDRIDNRFEGHRVGLWLLAIHVALKLVISINSIANTAKVASGADGFRLASYGGDGAQAVLMLFAVDSVAGLTLSLLGAIALLRYRAMVPMVILLLLFEFAGRRLVIMSYPIERGTSMSLAFALNLTMLALLLGALALSLWPRRRDVSPQGD